MSYTPYTLSKLNYPANVTSNTTYTPDFGETQSATLKAPFTGQDIHDNSYNLAVFAINAEDRLSNLEDKGVIVGSTISKTGYVTYNGSLEGPGVFYGGSPLYIKAETALAFPYDFGGLRTSAFRVGAGKAITSTGSVTEKNIRTFNFGLPTSTSYPTPASFVSYLNSLLKFNNKNLLNEFSVTGTTNVELLINTDYTSSLGTKKWFLFVNDDPNPISCSFTGGTFGSSAAFLLAVQNSLNTAYTQYSGFTSNPFSVTFVSNKLKITANTDRSIGGVYHFMLTPDESSDGVNPSILSDSFFGVLNGVSLTAEAYDFTSIFLFNYEQIGSTNTYYLTIEGQNSSMSVTFKDSDGAVTLGMLSGIMGITSFSSDFWSRIYYHARLPKDLFNINSVVPELNFGGDFHANKVICSGLTVSGDVTYSGVTTFEGTQNFGNIITSGNLKITGTSKVAGNFDAGENIPTSSNRLNYDGSFNSYNLIGKHYGLSIPTYIKDFPQSLFATATPTGFRLYNDGASANPVDGATEGTYNITLRTTDVLPLYQNYDYILTKGAVNYQGQGISYDFNVDKGMTGITYQVSFLYKTAPAYVSGDLGVSIYDVTAGGFILVNTPIPASTAGTRFNTTFTVSSNTSYRIIFHVSTVNANAYTFQFNGLSVSPLFLAPGVATNPMFRAEYTYSAGTLPTSGNAIAFNNKIEDVGGTGNSIIAGTFTAPKSGVYQVNVALGIAAGIVFTQSSYAFVRLSSGGNHKPICGLNFNGSGTTTATTLIVGEGTIRLNASSTMTVTLDHNLTSSFLTTGTYLPRITIEYLDS